MEIDETINKWLTLLDTGLANIAQQICPVPEIPNGQEDIYSYCSLVKVMVREYSAIILQLSNEGKELAAKVVLRTLAELVVKFSWCMNEAHKDISTFVVNCGRWTKSSWIEQQKFLKRAIEYFDDKQIEQNIKEYQNKIDMMSNIPNMPDNAQLCKELFGKNGSLNYLILLGQLHGVVHSNLDFLQKLKISDKNTLISDDGNNEVIKQMCMVCIYLLLKYIYQYYKIDFSIIESDYLRLKK
jgi:hypothetical protein